MGRRGMSLQEKKDALVNILHKSLAPYTVKELEKLGSKAGVNSMSVKGVLEELRDDYVVDSDKIGSSIYYWSFPSKQLALRLKQNKELETLRQTLAKQVESLEQEKVSLLADRAETADRSRNLAELKSLLHESKTLNEQLSAQKELHRHKELASMLNICKDACTRWTDNTWAFASYIKKKHGSSVKDAQKALQMKDDFDYPVYVPKRKKVRRN